MSSGRLATYLTPTANRTDLRGWHVITTALRRTRLSSSIPEAPSSPPATEGEGGGALFDVLVEPRGEGDGQRPIFSILVSIVLGILLALSLAFGIPQLLRWWKKRVREKRMKE